MNRIILFLLLLIASNVAGAVDDNLLAHRLFSEGKYAQAAEIFTDPAWKGVALYRSNQWWRAAEAFVRAEDPVSHYNLGNCYVKLGYYALALDAYQSALAAMPKLDDAAHNADLMLALLAEDNKQNDQGALQSQQQEIERVEDDGEDGNSSSPGDEPDDVDKTGDGDAGEGTSSSKPSTPDTNPGDSGDAKDKGTSPPGSEGGSQMSGKASDQQSKDKPSGGSDSDNPSSDSQAAGLRSQIESEQATEQWLNRIQHDPYQFLQRRIELELNRRVAAGQTAPEGGSSW